MTRSHRPVVAFLQKSLARYRAPFFALLRERLHESGVHLRVVYGDADAAEASRRDSATLSWGEFRPNRRFRVGSRDLVWQPAADVARAADLVVVEDATKLLVNYPLLAAQASGLTRVAYWGHGGNLQGHSAHREGEFVKRMVSRLPHWWFAYTEGTRARVEALGYPSSRITVVQNAIDTAAILRAREALTVDDADSVRADLGLGDGPVVATLGGLYEDKRLPFLVEACDRISEEIEGFRLLVVGDGPFRSRLEEIAKTRQYIRLLGARFDADKARVLSPASLLLIPGLVGLTIVDAFALELPLVTTAIDYHSPEIEYLVAETNGVSVDAWDDASSYARVVIDLLRDEPRLARLRDGCRRDATRYTLESMVDRYSSGLLTALQAPARQNRRVGLKSATRARL